MRIFMVYCLSLLACTACASTSSLKIGVVSDIHYLSLKLMDDGEAVKNLQVSLGRNLSDFEALLDETLDALGKEQIDVLLIPGDLTLNGEKQSHLDLSEKLNRLRKKGTRIFVIPGNHDINIPNPVGFRGAKTYPTENISPSEFESIYAACGYQDAIAKDPASLSYVASLDKNTWLLAIDTNRYQEYKNSSITAGRILPETEQWIINILHQAKRKNKKVIGMMHHGLAEHIAFQDMLFPQYLVKDWMRLAGLFADNGLKFVFTGHFHSNDITSFVSNLGNEIIDIETGSLQTFPYPYRIVSLTDNQLKIETRHITEIPGNPLFVSQGEELVRQWIGRQIQHKIKERMPSDFPNRVVEEIIKVGTDIMLQHIEGDEVLDENLQKKLQKVLSAIDIPMEISPESLQLDFPPGDNNVVLDF